MFYYNISRLCLRTVLPLYIVKFWFCFVKYFVLLTSDRLVFFADGTFMSTISFILCFLFKLIGRLGRIFVPTLLSFCRLPILDFHLETAVGCTLIFLRFLPKYVVPKLWNSKYFWFLLDYLNLVMNLMKATLNSLFSFLIFSFTVLKKIMEHFWSLFCETVMTNTIGFTF